VEGKAPKDALFRLGGMVIKGSVERPNDGLMVRFKLTDFSKDVTVEYTGILPDLFREGQGIVAHGRLNAQGVLSPKKCWPNMMRIICRRKLKAV
jgi:Cytochrome c-type biogenesis protein CcmE